MTPKQLGLYQLIKLLGSGRTAEVHCAKHKITKELVAIKLLHEFLTDQQMKQKFLAEAKIVQMLSHPGIVRILDADFYQQTRPYLVMTYAPGNSLHQKHPGGSVLSFQTILSHTKQIASALTYAHQKNIIHCDVKPENILVGKDGHLLLGDFGIARIRETTLSQTTRDAFGTATYMAPEQFRGKYSSATDQYALATMIYEWFCGSPPFSGDNYNQLMDRHMNMPVPSLREVCKECDAKRNIPLAVEHVLSKALAKDPNARFPSIGEFALALEQALPPDIVLNDATPRPENTASTIKRHFGSSRISSQQYQMRHLRQWHVKRRLVLGGLAGLIGTTIVGTFAWQSHQQLMHFFSSSPSNSPTQSKTPPPRTETVPGSPTQTSARQELQRRRFYLFINVNGVLNDSPQAINDVKRQVKQVSFLQGRSVGTTLVYGGASPGNEEQAANIAMKIYKILQLLGQEGFAFQNASYYDPLFTYQSDPTRVIVDVYLFAK